ncbi:hypothetical protein HPP92_014549 [Vanilla planifolia]|uniref:alpha-amylase n=1 Tax=Vanilla planifolia TaxID=51239 RepID=A0A835UUW6_VANPL|nr:hypothetical protein HPP92_014549 [Vanilla planifolia]
MGHFETSCCEKDQETAFVNGEVIRKGREILFQGFNWESHKHIWWDNLEKKVDDLAESGFTSVWLPPATHSLSPEGYLPQDLYLLDSSYGSKHQLKALLQKLSHFKIRAMADIVINHRVGTVQGHGALYNRYDGIPMSWDEHAVTSCSGGMGNKSTGENFHGVPNIDHTQPFVRKDIITWLIWLCTNIGFQDFRFDFAKGYDAKFVKEYVEQSLPKFSVGEYWDNCSYSSIDQLDYNQAVKGELWRLRDLQGKPPGLLGWWPSRAVTFIENHDTGSTQGHWPFPSDHIMEGYAYLLTHPGMPMVFYDHFYDWGSHIHDQIVKLIDVRRRQDIHSRSPIRILEAKSDLYAAVIEEKVCMKIGDGSWCPAAGDWKLATSGHRYAVWCK